MLVKDLLAHFGIQKGSVHQRARMFLEAGGFDHEPYANIVLGSPDFLVSHYRRELIARRDRYRPEAL